MMARTDRDLWTPDLVRELLVVVYGGHYDASDGLWRPDVHEVARRRRVSVRTVQRWVRGNEDDVAIPQAQLDAILARRRPQRKTLAREQLALRELERKRARAGLGRGRGNLAEYARLGWLDPHKVLVVEDSGRPLRRPVVTIDSPKARARALHGGGKVVDLLVAEDKFAAEAWRYRLLDAVAPWRLQLPASKVVEGRTQVWLSSAQLPVIPLGAAK